MIRIQFFARPGLGRGLVGCALLLAFALPATASVGVPEPGFDAAKLAHAARRSALPPELRLVGVIDGAADVELELRRFQVTTRDARLVVHGGDGTREERLPATVYLRGAIVGEPASRAVIALEPDGAVRGLVERGSGFSRLASRGLDGAIELLPVRCAGSDARTGAGFRCETPDAPLLDPEPRPSPVEGISGGAAPRAARIAIETDFEYYQRFSDAHEAARYALDLLAFSSTIYADETDTDLLVPYLSLWTVVDDPWTATTSSAGLSEFASFWNANRSGVPRTLAHFLSGRSTGGGIAFVGVLCSTGAGYGFTGNISGNFDPDNPQTVWDILAVSHEIGHNFNSPHTHCYNGIAGEASAIDGCWNSQGGCYAGTVGLPGVGTVTGGTTAERPGTIMSYCHQRSGGYSNIALTFGEDWTYGVAAGRVPSRMSAAVTSAAASNPACFAPPASSLLFADGLESAGPWRWSDWSF